MVRAAALAGLLAAAVPAPGLAAPESVRYVDLGGGFGYLRIPGFERETASDVMGALARPPRSGLRGLILDLRGNTGGLLSEAVRVADLFLDPRSVIVYVEEEAPGQGVKLSAKYEDAAGVPVAVLVNGETAAAAELVAGALQDHRRAVLVGTPTAGIVSIRRIHLQEVPRPNAFTPRFYTPAGRDLEGRGLEPDVAADSAAAIHADPGSDPTVLRAVEILVARGGRKP